MEDIDNLINNFNLNNNIIINNILFVLDNIDIVINKLETNDNGKELLQYLNLFFFESTLRKILNKDNRQIILNFEYKIIALCQRTLDKKFNESLKIRLINIYKFIYYLKNF